MELFSEEGLSTKDFQQRAFNHELPQHPRDELLGSDCSGSSGSAYHRTKHSCNSMAQLTVQLRLINTLPGVSPRAPLGRERGSPTQLHIVLGSGGHTSEMFMLMSDMDPASYTFRRYVISSGDTFSARMASRFEEELAEKARSDGTSYGAFDIKVVSRARNIHQPLWTTPMSALKCLWDCIAVLRGSPPYGLNVMKMKETGHSWSYPDLIIANGPATAAIFILASYLLRFFAFPGSQDMRSIYVESWARVKTPSLSGRLLLAAGMCDRFLVQWDTIKPKRGLLGGKAEYLGSLVL